MDNNLQILLVAIRQWHCDSCGGSGVYRQPWAKDHPNGYEVSCRRCEGHGLHPIAKRALDAINMR